MAGKIANMVGLKFGKLLVISIHPCRKNQQVVWRCQCECGNDTLVLGADLRIGHTKSCGCLLAEARRKSMLKLRARTKDTALKTGKRLVPNPNGPGTIVQAMATKAASSSRTIKAWQRRSDIAISPTKIVKEDISQVFQFIDLESR